jgi:hypothetical protein
MQVCERRSAPNVSGTGSRTAARSYYTPLMYRALAVFFVPVLAALAQDPTPELGWQPASRMAAARYDHCAVPLADGRVFVAGGMGAAGPLNSVEIYGPQDSFQPAPPMTFARAQHSCTLLDDGRVLVAGGAGAASAELFDPVSATWSSVGGLMVARRGQTATPISGGRVLLAGGWVGDRATGALEIYDPEAERISALPAVLAVPRARHSAVLLSDGRVLFIGGADSSKCLASTEVFDPVAATVTLAAPMSQVRAGHATVTLMDRRMLVAGGTSCSDELASAEVYSESSGLFTRLDASLTIPRQNAFAILIPGSGLVLIGGGERGGQALADTELFDPGSNQFVVAGSLTAARTRINGAPLADGVILATGGMNADGPSNACGVLAAPRLTFTLPQYNSGEIAVVNGSGFTAFSGRTIPLSLSKSASDGSVRTLISSRLMTASVVPDSSGKFQASIVFLNASDAGNTFFLEAIPPAPTSFSDGTSNTIIVSEHASASFTVPNVADTILTFDPIPATSVAGSTIPFAVTLNSSQSTPSFSGLVHIRVGPTVKAFTVTNVAPGTKTNFSFCCVNTPGSQFVNVNYGVDPLHLSVTMNGPNHTVVAPQVQITASTTLPLFQRKNIPVVISVPAAIGPVPTGTVTLARTGTASQTATLPAGSSTTLSRSVAFPFKATFAEKPSACFTVTYSGDSIYPAASANPCFDTGPAVASLQLQGLDNYTYGSPSPVQVKLTFPAELGLISRTVHLDPIGRDLTLDVGVGSATVTTALLYSFALKGITAIYAGGGDVSAAGDKLAFSMNPVVTQTRIDALPPTASNPLTLRATVTPVAPAGVAAPPAPTGVVQFFDGTLFLGQASLAAQTDGTLKAVLSGVARPVGARPFKAVYLGSSFFTSSTSPVVTVTIQ